MKRRDPVTAGLVLVPLLAAVLLAPAAPAAPPRVPTAPPADVGMDAAKLRQIDAVVAEGIAQKKMPGCVVAIGRRGKLALLAAYGHRQLVPEKVPMTVDTLFDLASVTKPVATTTSVMILVERGKIALDAPVARYVPEFGSHGKEKITVFDLLTHQGGLVADNPMSDYKDGPARAWERIFAQKPVAAPGAKYIYTDVGFLMLGEIVRRVSGEDVDAFSRHNVFEPLGMRETRYLPRPESRRRAAMTEQREGHWMQGEVHDPRAHALGGVAGHAGLFSTAEDLAVFSQMMLGDGEYHGARILNPETVALMTTPCRLPGAFRALGWDRLTPSSTNRSPAYSPRAFGHGGFTGTSLWIDPKLDLFVIFLSNRVHPDGEGAVNPIAARIGTIAVESIVAPSVPPANPRVLTGIDVLRREGFAQLAGRRVGLITNHTGRARDGISTARLLAGAKGVTLVALFSPEHGLEGRLDVAEIADSRQEGSGLPIHSLYGKTRKPTPESLEGIDTLVFDIQDVGCRFYTYISTMGLAMQAAAERKIRFVVLDRPNPIGGLRVAGPVLDAGSESFVAFHRLPVQHGMSVGELAKLFDAELDLKLDLQVIPMEGWRRGDRFEATGLPWVNPSPNMRSPTEALLYPGIGLLETTNLSVGRGTPTPFELVGAPWLDGRRLAGELAKANLPGVRVRPAVFRPEAGSCSGEICGGLEFTVTDPTAMDSLRLGLEIARALHRLYPAEWKTEGYNRLLGSRATLKAVLADEPFERIEAAWQPELGDFLKRRAKHLLYGETGPRGPEQQ